MYKLPIYIIFTHFLNSTTILIKFAFSTNKNEFLSTYLHLNCNHIINNITLNNSILIITF